MRKKQSRKCKVEVSKSKQYKPLPKFKINKVYSAKNILMSDESEEEE
jgi:hypothetical protein